MTSNDTTGTVQGSPHDHPAGPTLEGLARALWGRRLWLILPVLVAAVLAALWLMSVTPLYRSSVTVLIESQETAFTRPAGSADERNLLDQETVRSQEQLILSRDLNRDIVRRLNLASEPEFSTSAAPASLASRLLSLVGVTRDRDRLNADERLLDRYYDRLSVYQVDSSRVLVIEFRSQDPELAARVANAVANGYLEMQRSAQRDATATASNWLSGEVDRLRGQVEEAERRVEEYRRETGLYSGSQVGGELRTLADQELQELTSQLAVARSTKSDAQARARLIGEMLDRGRAMEASDVINSQLVQRLNEQQIRIRAQLAELSSSLGPRHPRILELNSELAGLRSQMREEGERIVRVLENDALVAAQSEAELIEDIEALKVRAGGASEQEVTLRMLEREARTQRELLDSMLSRLREASSRDSFDALPVNARIVSRASAASAPFHPRPVPTLLLAMLAAGVLSGGAVVTAELLRASGTAPMNVPEFVPVPATSLSAHLELGNETDGAGQPGSTATGSAMSGLDAIAQAVGASHGAGARLALVTSARRLPAICDMALRLARRVSGEGRRVVLVDIRFNEEIPELQGVPLTGGLAPLLLGSCSFDSALHRDPRSRVHVIPAGHTKGDPLMLVSSSRMDTILQALRQTYDVVIIVAPPVNRRVEARILARQADFAVIAAGSHESEALTNRARDRLNDAGIEDIAMVTVAGAGSRGGSKDRYAA